MRANPKSHNLTWNMKINKDLLTFENLYFVKGGFFQKVRFAFQISKSPKKNIPKNFKHRIIFWNIFFLEIWKTNRTFWKKATFKITLTAFKIDLKSKNYNFNFSTLSSWALLPKDIFWQKIPSNKWFWQPEDLWSRKWQEIKPQKLKYFSWTSVSEETM